MHTAVTNTTEVGDMARAWSELQTQAAEYMRFWVTMYLGILQVNFHAEYNVY